MKRGIRIILLLLWLFLLGIAAVYAQEETPPDSGVLRADNRPRVRVVNGSLQVTSANVYIDGILYFQNVPSRFISNYVPLPDTGVPTHTIGIRAADSSDEGFLVESQAPLETGADYTILLWDNADGLTPPWVLLDENNQPIRAGFGAVRLVRAASTNTPPVEMCLSQRCGILTNEQRVSNYIQLEPETYGMGLRMVDATRPVNGVFPVTLDAGEVYSIFMFDPQEEGQLPQIVPYIDTKQRIAPTSDSGSPPAETPPYPSDPVPPPLYPPVTGAFLSPAARLWLGGLVVGLIAAGWLVWKRRPSPRLPSR
ncbi:MAG: DUF4397 domain-containing protein [Chloroflexi bacterium]|nr:MAG: DUF4397 domain-containing protein [Chloroflexota bacterium]